jgi:TPR repeat protein
MLTFSRISGVVLFGLAACLTGSRIGAFEATDGATVEKVPLQTFATPRAALQAGLEVFRSGNATSAIEALKYAAAGGEVLAQWKLAKIYANGDGVPRDDLKA